MRRLALVSLGLAVAAGGCTRPVDRPAGGDTFITDILVTPDFVRADAPLEISFVANGQAPASVSYDISGATFPCTPERSGARLVCVHPGLSRDFPQGVALVVVKATGPDGAVSTGAAQVHVDFECPRVNALTLSKRIAEPGDRVVLNIEASELLGAPPVVTRLGRDWGVPVGSGTSWALARDITDADPAMFADLVVRVKDRAGNTSGDCSDDRHEPFAVDHEGPVANVSGVQLLRGAPGQPALLQAERGSFIDDVGIQRVRVLDVSGAVIASLEVDADGAIAAQSLGSSTASRVLVQAEDSFGRRSAPLAVREQWRVSVGSGSTPGAAVKTAVRYTAATPGSTSMLNRTVELAPDIAQEDARTAVIRAVVGFEKVGELPSRYENSKRSLAGYDPAGKAVVAVGGYNGPDLDGFNFYDGFMPDVQIIKWDEREGLYIPEQGPLLSYEDPSVPYPRWGVNMAFDGQGCGVMFGGEVRTGDTDLAIGTDLWRLCGGPGGYTWSRVDLPAEVDGQCVRNYAPLVWDSFNQRYIMAGDGAYSCGDTRVLFLEPAPGTDGWRWVNVQPLPTNFAGRFNSMLYVDPGHGGFALGLGGVSPIGNGEQALIWTYRNGQWTTSQAPRALWFRSRFGWGYDTARQMLTVWGGSDDSRYPALPEVWYLTDTSTNGPEKWRSTLLDNPVPREYPAMVYDSDREVMVLFGGVRWQDARPVAPDIYQLVSQPSFPQMQVVADLGAERPKGIERLVLNIRAQGSGDADGVRAGLARGGGVRVSLWDHEARRWVEQHAAARDVQNGLEDIQLSITQNPERFVSPTGTVPMTIAAYRPATEVIEGRLEVDVVDGYLDLRPGVTLP
jgi:hypothetical protein